MSETQKPEPPQRRTLTIDELAATLGVSVSTIHRRRKNARFPQPISGVGRCLRWSPRAIEKFLGYS